MRLTIEWKISLNDESITRMQKQMAAYIKKEIIKRYLDYQRYSDEQKR